VCERWHQRVAGLGVTSSRATERQSLAALSPGSGIVIKQKKCSQTESRPPTRNGYRCAASDSLRLVLRCRSAAPSRLQSFACLLPIGPRPRDLGTARRSAPGRCERGVQPSKRDQSLQSPSLPKLFFHCSPSAKPQSAHSAARGARQDILSKAQTTGQGY
jgi:hypothetical protein